QPRMESALCWGLATFGACWLVHWGVWWIRIPKGYLVWLPAIFWVLPLGGISFLWASAATRPLTETDWFVLILAALLHLTVSACYISGFANMAALVVLVLVLRPTGSAPRELLAGVLFTAAYGFCVNFLNWFVFTVTETSMHAHLLVEIGHAREITRAELEQRYNK